MSTALSSEKEDELIEKIAGLIVNSGMEVPATLALEFGKMSGMAHSFAQIGYSWTSWLFGLHPAMSQYSLEIVKLTSNPENIKRLSQRVEEKYKEKEEERKRAKGKSLKEMIFGKK
jgi:hypothetical protein